MYDLTVIRIMENAMAIVKSDVLFLAHLSHHLMIELKSNTTRK